MQTTLGSESPLFDSNRSDQAAYRRAHAVQLVVKRALDLTCALALLVSLLPVLVLVAIAVRCSSPGPVFFRQDRVGRNGRVFSFLKFRTMLHNSDPSIHRAYYSALVNGHAKPRGNFYKLAEDPRVTKLGRVLRRYSLDELPQLFNVVTGDMSLVGPRPPIPYEAELYQPRAWRRLSVTPGMTGLWQVSGRSLLTFEEMVELDLQYVEHWWLGLDVLILLRTPLVVVTGQGAT